MYYRIHFMFVTSLWIRSIPFPTIPLGRNRAITFASHNDIQTRNCNFHGAKSGANSMERHRQEATTQPGDFFRLKDIEQKLGKTMTNVIWSLGWFNQGKRMKRLFWAELESNCYQTTFQ